jgi:nitrogen fixation/metabolism regulation signal transduction histidine kinase
MNSNRFNISVILFSVAIAITSSLFMWAIGQDNKIVTSISLGIIWLLEVVFLIRYINVTNKNLLQFLQSFQFNDSTIAFNKNKKLPFIPVYTEFNRIIELFNQLKIEKEIEHQYFEHIIKHVDTGLIAWNVNDRVKLFNYAAKKLLNLPHIGNISGLKSVLNDMPEKLKSMQPGSQELLKILRGNELVSLYVRVSEFTVSGELIKLASFQNIHPEIEKSESEAWQKLIKVLTHEIVNSVGPMKIVSSTLLKTISKSSGATNVILTPEELENMFTGLNAIYNRSLGLSKFVDDYKTITDIPKPDFKEVRVADLIDEIVVLMRNNILNREIELNVRIDPSELRIFMDRKMIEQVVINLLKNAVHSLEDESGSWICITAERNNNRVLIIIEDNGCGIPFNMLDYIFMPFFTTKQDGSGIGLTLSRQIMKSHNGYINLISKEGEGTKVILTF